MKIQILQSVRDASNPKLAFFKGKVYRAEVATNIPQSFRLTKKGFNINKIFAIRADGSSMLIEKNDFKIVQLMPHERESLITNYLNSKIKPVREKLVVPRNMKLREGFRKMTDKELNNIKLMYCNSGSAGERCTKPADFIKEFNFKGRIVKICTCTKHATNRVK